MSKEFNSDMFSAILKANENSMALLEKQLEATQKQAKRKDIGFCIILLVLCCLLGGTIWAYSQKKVAMDLDYDQSLEDNNLVGSGVAYDNKIKAK